MNSLQNLVPPRRRMWEKCSLPNLTIASAAEQGDAELKEVLKTKSLDINAPNRCGVTALHTASGGGKVEVVKVLLQNGADVNSRTCTGSETPLHWAILGTFLSGFTADSKMVVKILLDNGADPTLKDDMKKTGYQIARKMGDKEVVEMMKNSFEMFKGDRCALCSKEFGLFSKLRDRAQTRWPKILSLDFLYPNFKQKNFTFKCKECHFQFCRDCTIAKQMIFSDRSTTAYSGTCFKCAEKMPIPSISWNIDVHQLFPARVRRQIRMILLMALRDKETSEPLYPEANFFALPRETLFVIFDYLIRLHQKDGPE